MRLRIVNFALVSFSFPFLSLEVNLPQHVATSGYAGSVSLVRFLVHLVRQKPKFLER